MQHGLTKHTIEKIVTVFARHEEIRRVVLYGSRAKGNFRKGSDIDLTIIGEGIGLTLLQHIENELDDLMLPYTMDVSLYTHIKSEPLLDHIRRVGIDIFSRSKECA